MNADPPPARPIPLGRFALLAAIIALTALFTSVFFLPETDHAIIVRFGKPVRQLREPGMYLRLPAPIDKVILIDRRLHHADIRLSETLTRDRRNVIVPTFFTWKVRDPLQYHVSVGSVTNANGKLDAIVTSSRNSVLGRHDFVDLVSGSADGALPELEGEMLALAREEAGRLFGIDLLSVGISRILLPEANTQSVFVRMRAERKREAAGLRAEGRAAAASMNAETDKQAAAITTEANRQAEEIRGNAEAEAATIYATAHGKDPDFYRFLRELQSLRTVVDKNTTLVLDTNTGPFRWLKSPAAEERPPLATPPPAPSPETLNDPVKLSR